MRGTAASRDCEFRVRRRLARLVGRSAGSVGEGRKTGPPSVVGRLDRGAIRIVPFHVLVHVRQRAVPFPSLSRWLKLFPAR
jgi:hypothetical protein